MTKKDRRKQKRKRKKTRGDLMLMLLGLTFILMLAAMLIGPLFLGGMVIGIGIIAVAAISWQGGKHGLDADIRLVDPKREKREKRKARKAVKRDVQELFTLFDVVERPREGETQGATGETDEDEAKS